MRHRTPPTSRNRGALAVEAAFALPVIIAGAMMFMELGNIGLAINMGSSALEHAIAQFREDPAESIEAGQMERMVRQRMAAASHGYLGDSDIATVAVESFTSLDALDGNDARKAKTAPTRTVPVWRITVEIRKNFITPLPRLLGTDGTAFRYQYQHLLGDLPAQTHTLSQAN
ncbi:MULTISPECIES: hypothetical protein [unclassified Cupriavidus]|uniref:hypothetical protein n=1 Tax=unclassified Cupriavidus TaxID=2640874 RepID=UPI0013663329|nr:hypothetical protein [Cupriavidus sp. SW-Y-13]MWL89359.1 hypothetical protein [Cupriavidus sp. SW-Y-13]